jgi:hypothetical protein
MCYSKSLRYRIKRAQAKFASFCKCRKRYATIVWISYHSQQIVTQINEITSYHLFYFIIILIFNLYSKLYITDIMKTWLIFQGKILTWTWFDKNIFFTVLGFSSLEMCALQNFNPNLYGVRSKKTYLFWKAHKLKPQRGKNLKKICIPCKSSWEGMQASLFTI